MCVLSNAAPPSPQYGSKNSIARAGVQNILNAVIKELAWNPDRKFIYVEQAFFQRWWDEADTQTAALVKTLVANGQLEFINGGWSVSWLCRAVRTLRAR